MLEIGKTGEALPLALRPLVELLQQELAHANIALPGPQPTSISEFAHWYLEAVQRLEQFVASADAHAPMSRTEVELMCRCVMSAVDLREAIGLLSDYCAMLHPRAGQIRLTMVGENAVFQLDSLRRERSSAATLVDITGLFSFLQLLQWLGGAQFPLKQVRIGPLEREDLIPFLKLFRAPVLAGGDQYSLEFVATHLARPVVRTRAEFAEFFELFPCAVFHDPAHGLTQQVDALISAAVMQGRAIPSLEEVAATLERPPSTFRRQLQRAATSFRILRDNCLKAQAQRLLLRGDMSVEQIASRLGYSDASTFRRAFRNWCGVAPTRWSAGVSHSSSIATGVEGSTEAES
ncbi:putative HTH-type transcriptional regulator [Halioglobus japonicus]|nr:putative HTH-type transcriptional regulator [Halioglobus japonicus]